MTTKPRHSMFQNNDYVMLTIMKKNVLLQNCVASLTDGYLIVKELDDILFKDELYSGVKSDDITVTCTSNNIEVKLPKIARCEHWPRLLKEEAKAKPITFATKNWDAIEKQAQKDEEEEDLEGDAAVNRMFQKIYKDSPDDVKKAMMKSYQESAGTVLSTNWSDISNRKVEVQPPDCMEHKKFSQ